MPHQCTTCGHTFADGSKEMLGGCPDCGGNTFQFHPPGSDPPDEPPADPERPEREDPTGASAVGRAATRVRDFVSGDRGGSDDPGVSGDPDASGNPGVSDGSPDPPNSGDTPEGKPPGMERSPGGSGDLTDGFPERAEGSPERPGDDPVDAVRTDRSDGASGTGKGTESGTTEVSDTRDLRESRRGSRDFSREPDPNAPWPTEAGDPTSSGGDGGEKSAPGTDDDIIDADARETERAIGNAEDGEESGEPEEEALAGQGSPDPTSGATPDGPDGETPSTSGGGRESSTSAPGAPGEGNGLAAAENTPAGEGQVVSEPSEDQPDLADLREQLNEQFESIKILEPGQYELNLMELYDREEYIIALQENGRYVIQVPENWMGDRPGDG